MRTDEEAVVSTALYGNDDEVKDRIQKLLPGERQRLEKACRLICKLIRLEGKEEP